jgi:hypothetical protein
MTETLDIKKLIALVDTWLENEKNYYDDGACKTYRSCALDLALAINYFPREKSK